MILCGEIFTTSYAWRVKIELGKKFPIKNELCKKLLFAGKRWTGDQFSFLNNKNGRSRQLLKPLELL